MKVMFLDIDGVLNSTDYFKAKVKELGHPLHRSDMINPDAVNILNRITDETKASLVISSSWRIGTDLESLKLLLKGAGVTASIISKTPDLGSYRGTEILSWLLSMKDRHDRDHIPAITNFCILDDDSDMGMLASHSVYTRNNIGLTSNHIPAIEAVLKSPLPPFLINYDSASLPL